MNKLESIIDLFPMRRETYFDLELPLLRRILRVEVIGNKPYVWVLYQLTGGQTWGVETLRMVMLCEGQKLETDITELDYWGSLTFHQEDYQTQYCHYFTYRKEGTLYGTGKRNLGIGEEHRLRVA